MSNATVIGFHHTSFTVSDVTEATRFFVELIGLERLGGGCFDHDNLQTMVGYAGAVLKIAYLGFPERDGARPPHLLELIEYVQPAGTVTDTATNRPGNAHLSFQVADIHAVYERLRAHGVCFRSPPKEVLWGVNKGAWSVYFRGPDNVALELTQPAAAAGDVDVQR